MAIAFLHVGQAGIQVAEPLWSLARDHPSAQSWLFDESARAHCLLIDCEPRVARATARNLRGVVRDDAVHVLNAHGSANNWAMGFTSVSDDALHTLSDALRRMVERMDWWSGTAIAHSLAGGTGSGLGSRLLLDIRDHYPKKWLLSAAVLPLDTGDSALQSFNTALALAHVQEHADLGLLFENSQLLGAHERCEKAGLGAPALSPSRPRTLASMHDLNAQIACALGGALFPLDEPAGRARAADLGSLVCAVSPLPSLKFAEAHAVRLHSGGTKPQLRRAESVSGGLARPARTHMAGGSWDVLGDRLAAQLPRFHGTERAVTLCAQGVVRGATSAETKSACAKLERWLGASPLSPFGVEWRHAPSQQSARGLEQSLSVVANRTSVEAVISKTLRRAGAQLEAGAYVHHYARHGCAEAMLREYVDECWRIVVDYRQVQAVANLKAARQQPPAGPDRRGSIPSGPPK